MRQIVSPLLLKDYIRVGFVCILLNQSTNKLGTVKSKLVSLSFFTFWIFIVILKTRQLFGLSLCVFHKLKVSMANWLCAVWQCISSYYSPCSYLNCSRSMVKVDRKNPLFLLKRRVTAAVIFKSRMLQQQQLAIGLKVSQKYLFNWEVCYFN